VSIDAVTETRASSEELEYVGFWARVGAAIVDTILALILTTPLLRLFGGSDDWQQTELTQWQDIQALSWSSFTTVSSPAELLISYGLPIVAILLFWIARQATPGKMLISARIVDARTGGKPGAGQLLVRYLGYYLSILGFFLGFAWVGWDSRKQGWHDKLAGTVVVRSRKRTQVRFGP